MRAIMLCLVLVALAGATAAGQSLIGTLETQAISTLTAGFGYSHDLLDFLSLYAGLHFRSAGEQTVVGTLSTAMRASFAYIPDRVIASLHPDSLDGSWFAAAGGPALLFRAFDDRTTRTVWPAIRVYRMFTSIDAPDAADADLRYVGGLEISTVISDRLGSSE